MRAPPIHLCDKNPRARVTRGNCVSNRQQVHDGIVCSMYDVHYAEKCHERTNNNKKRCLCWHMYACMLRLDPIYTLMQRAVAEARVRFECRQAPDFIAFHVE